MVLVLKRLVNQPVSYQALPTDHFRSLPRKSCTCLHNFNILDVNRMYKLPNIVGCRFPNFTVPFRKYPSNSV